MEEAPVSVASLIASRGRSVALYRPSVGRRADGTKTRTESKVAEYVAFIQPNSATQQRQQGRETMRQEATIYFEGVVDIRTDDEIGLPSSLPQVRYRVSGVRIPDEILSGTPNAHTIVDATRILPALTT
jgi:hypothetical protein